MNTETLHTDAGPKVREGQLCYMCSTKHEMVFHFGLDGPHCPQENSRPSLLAKIRRRYGLQ